jgi:hypothetical protein
MNESILLSRYCVGERESVCERYLRNKFSRLDSFAMLCLGKEFLRKGPSWFNHENT